MQNFLTKDMVELELRNDAFMAFQLRFVSTSPLNSPAAVSAPAPGNLLLQFANAPDVPRRQPPMT